jgi:5'-deoxynucleotidase YfbR-like HD superfamily hydrolase
VIEYFSVAQHSVLVSSVLPDKLKLCGLMHDSAEAYVGDLSSPLKALVMEYISIEHVILKKIAEKYVFSYPFPPEIKLADTQLLLAEKAVLFKDDMQWREEFCIQRLDIEIVPLPPKEAEKAFLDAFSALTRY